MAALANTEKPSETAMLDRAKLTKVLALLASDKNGEALNAARLAARLVAQSGLTWQQVVEPEVDGVAAQAERQLLAEYDQALHKLLAENDHLRADKKQLQNEVGTLQEHGRRWCEEARLLRHRASRQEEIADERERWRYLDARLPPFGTRSQFRQNAFGWAILIMAGWLLASGVETLLR